MNRKRARQASDVADSPAATVAAARRHDATWLLLLAEFVVILAWALWVGRAYLNFDARVWPNGGEFGTVIQSQFAWERLPECGACVLWNGLVNGGHPTFADMHGAPAHPLVALTTVLFGAINSSKLVIIASLAMAGLAQWWLARALGLGSGPRLWSAALAVAGGHLAGRMDSGLYPLVLSLASVSLVMAASLELGLHPSHRAAAALGVLLALAVVSGQGYMQVGLLLAIVPAWLLLLFDGKVHLRPVWRAFAWSILIGCLVSAVQWIPVVRTWPHLAKHLDPSFDSAQPLAITPLNLVLSDMTYLRTAILGKQPWPYLYTNYVGWIPVLLALAALRLAPSNASRPLAFLLASLVLALAVASAIPFKTLAKVAPVLVNGVRNPPLIGGLAVPPLLALAAWGADRLLRGRGVSLSLTLNESTVVRLNLLYVAMALLAFWSLRSCYAFSQHWLRVIKPHEEHFRLSAALPDEGAQWVAAPFGKHPWNPAMAAEQRKLTDVVLPWRWAERKPPRPRQDIRSAQEAVPEGGVILQTSDDLNLIVYEDRHYAAILDGSGAVTPCVATATGGLIEVRCTSTEAGQLIVQENYFGGWVAWRDGIPVDLETGPWLEAEAPAGEHAFTFRYRPWDVWAGLGLSVVGLALAGWMGLRREKGAH